MDSKIQLLLLLLYTTSSGQRLRPQTDVWNASYRLLPEQIAAANISEATTHNVEVALRYERTNSAGNLIQNDPFYELPADYDPSNSPPPGTVLKVEQYTNVSLYTMPMSLSMSRILYTTETFDGLSKPASAYVLWPYLPRKFAGLTPCSKQHTDEDPLFPVVGFAHGTSGQTQACAPSGLRNLWDEFHGSFPLALEGYAVVAPDYLGLGVANPTSPYFVLPSQANDLFHAIAAAQKAWPNLLSKQFVISGQSQGGGVVWAAAQRQAQRPVEGYLGASAASPFTDILGDIAGEDLAQVNGRVAAIAQGFASVLPGFELGEWLTDAGIARLKLLQEIQGCGITGAQLFSAEDGTVQVLKDGWNLTGSAKWYNDVSSNGRKPFAGPMLAVQGTDDPNAIESVTTKSVRQTCAMYPDSQLEYIIWEDITHVPVLYAGGHLRLDWVRDRFEGVSVPQGCSIERLSPSRGPASVDFEGFADQTWFLEYDKYGV